MTKKTILILLFLTMFLLIGCESNNDNSQELKEIFEEHHLENYQEIDFDKKHLFKLNFQNDKKHLLYEDVKESNQHYYNDKMVYSATTDRKSYFVYNFNKNIFETQFFGHVKYQYLTKGGNNKNTTHTFDTDAANQNNTFAVNVKSIKPFTFSTIKKKGKYQTNSNFSLIFFNLEVESELKTQIDTFIENEFSDLKLYKDTNENYLLRKDKDDSIWSLKYDKDFNVLSFYNYSTLKEIITTLDETIRVIDNSYLSYIIFDTDIDLSFDFSTYKKVESIVL